MSFSKITCTFLIIAFFTLEGMPALQHSDSLLNQREIKYNDYNQFKKSIESRTWINMVILDKKADSLIELDNRIIDRFLAAGKEKDRVLTDSLEKLNLESILLRKEAEMNDSEMTKKSVVNNTLFILVICCGLLLIFQFFLLMQKRSQNRALRGELEHFWSNKEDLSSLQIQKNGINNITQKMTQLSEENDKLREDLKQTIGQKSEAVEALKNEIRTRRQVEKEIKELISQIRKAK